MIWYYTHYEAENVYNNTTNIFWFIVHDGPCAYRVGRK